MLSLFDYCEYLKLELVSYTTLLFMYYIETESDVSQLGVSSGRDIGT